MASGNFLMHCDFCGKGSDEVKAIVVGKYHFAICDECVAAAQRTIEEYLERLKHKGTI